MNEPNIQTFGELRKTKAYSYRSVKQELAENLSIRLRNKERVFPRIHGYEDTVIPQLIHAILS